MINTFKVRVAWGGEGSQVQVSTQPSGVDSGAKIIVRYVNEWLEATGQKPIDFDSIRNLPIEGHGEHTSPHFDGFHATLDRHGINKLIKHLRRARDAVYGRDE